MHNSCFMVHKREKSKKIRAKLQFIDGSNFVKLSKRRTKNVSRESLWFVVSLIWQIQKCSNFVKLSKQMHMGSREKILLRMYFVEIHWRLRILILSSQCVGVAIEGMDIWYMGLIYYVWFNVLFGNNFWNHHNFVPTKRLSLSLLPNISYSVIK